MTDVSEQQRLTLPREPMNVDIEQVRAMPTMTRAIQLCAQLAGLVNDKDEARVLGIDSTTWSLIKAGQRAFPQDKYLLMFNEFRNRVPVMWLVDQCDCVMVPKESALQRDLRLEREARRAAEEKLAYAESLLIRR